MPCMTTVAENPIAFCVSTLSYRERGDGGAAKLRALIKELVELHVAVLVSEAMHPVRPHCAGRYTVVERGCKQAARRLDWAHRA